MRAIAGLLCVLAVTAGEARADILELLKTHKIVVGPPCIDQGKKTCTPPPMNAQNEIILVKGIIYHRHLSSGGRGFIYPLGREEDILNHPLMKDDFQRSSGQMQYDYFRTKAQASGNVLTLVRKSRGELLSPRFAFDNEEATTITISGETCSSVEEHLKPMYRGTTMRMASRRARCQLVALSGDNEGPRARTLSLMDIAQSFEGKHEKTSEHFTLINERLHYPVTYCADGSRLTVEFDWKGGALSGTHRCDTETAGRVNHHTLSYTSTVTVENGVYRLVASGTHDNKGYAGYSRRFELDMRLAIGDGKCGIEKFYLKESYGRSSPFIRANHGESKCFLD